MSFFLGQAPPVAGIRLLREADLSVSTLDRVLSGKQRVQPLAN